MDFVFQKVHDRGSATPCVARTVLQTQELIQAFHLSEDTRRQILDISYAVMEHLLACVDVAERVQQQVAEGQKKVDAGEVKVEPRKVAQLPSVVNLRKEAESFLYSAKLALRDAGRLFEPFHQKKFDHLYHKARRWAEDEFGVDSRLATLLREDAHWLERIIDLRNAVEHPRDDGGPLRIKDFSLTHGAGGTPLVIKPVWCRAEEEPVPIAQEMEVIQHNLLTFFEDLLCALLEQLPDPVGLLIYEIKEEDRDPAKPIRLQVTLRDGLPNAKQPHEADAEAGSAQ